MKRPFWFVLLLIVATTALAQTPAPAAKAPAAPQAKPAPTIASELDRRLSGVEREFVALADAMPEDKYAFAPTQGEFKGVRTFAEQVKHVAFTNHMFFSAMLGEAPPAAGNDKENGPASIKTKAEIMKYLRDSFALGHRAIAAINDQNAVAPIKTPFGQGTRLGLATLVVGHCFDHYGQMIEYVRMNGILPPSARRR